MYRSPITDANFLEAWDYGSRKCREAKKKRAIRKIVIPVSQVLFFLCFLVVTYGIAYDGFPELVRSFLNKIPYSAEIWQQISVPLLDSAQGYGQQLLRLGIFVYGLPLAVTLVLWLLVVLIYHPRTPALSNDKDLYSRDLFVVSQQAYQYRTPKYISSLPFLSLFFAIILIGSCVAFMLYYKNHPAVYEVLQWGMAQASFYFVMGCFLAFLAYLLFNLPLRLVVSLLYTCKVPKFFIEDAVHYHWQKTKGGTPEVPFQSAPQPEPAPAVSQEEKKAPEEPPVPEEASAPADAE